MVRMSIISCVVVITVFAGCAGLGTERPAETIEEPATVTPQTRTLHQCDTFGTGGIAPLAETNSTVTTVRQANRTLHTVVSGLPDADTYPYNASDLDYVSRDTIDENERRAVRDELHSVPANTTLYYFSPHDYTRIDDDMVIVSENGGVFVVFIGAC